jgi:hypothetical protein
MNGDRKETDKRTRTKQNRDAGIDRDSDEGRTRI